MSWCGNWLYIYSRKTGNSNGFETKRYVERTPCAMLSVARVLSPLIRSIYPHPLRMSNTQDFDLFFILLFPRSLPSIQTASLHLRLIDNTGNIPSWGGVQGGFISLLQRRNWIFNKDIRTKTERSIFVFILSSRGEKDPSTRASISNYLK